MKAIPNTKVICLGIWHQVYGLKARKASGYEANAVGWWETATAVESSCPPSLSTRYLSGWHLLFLAFRHPTGLLTAIGFGGCPCVGSGHNHIGFNS